MSEGWVYFGIALVFLCGVWLGAIVVWEAWNRRCAEVNEPAEGYTCEAALEETDALIRQWERVYALTPSPSVAANIASLRKYRLRLERELASGRSEGMTVDDQEPPQ
jgi:hypothetical protein